MNKKKMENITPMYIDIGSKIMEIVDTDPRIGVPMMMFHLGEVDFLDMCYSIINNEFSDNKSELYKNNK